MDTIQEQEKIKKIQIKEFQEMQSALMKKYSTGSLTEARQALEQEVFLVDHSTCLETNARYCILVFTYVRLYLLETRSHVTDSADMAMLGAQYWASKKAGLDDLSSANELESIAPTNLLKTTDFINDLDKGINGGKEPKYVSELAAPKKN